MPSYACVTGSRSYPHHPTGLERPPEVSSEDTPSSRSGSLVSLGSCAIFPEPVLLGASHASLWASHWVQAEWAGGAGSQRPGTQPWSVTSLRALFLLHWTHQSAVSFPSHHVSVPSEHLLAPSFSTEAHLEGNAQGPGEKENTDGRLTWERGRRGTRCTG